VIYLADCVELMRLMPAGSVDAVFVDQPYRLSNGGVTVKNGRLESVDKGAWGRSLGSFEKDHAFNERWVGEARRVPKPDGTIWVSGTYHVIFSIGFALQSSGFRIINSVVREKPDPSPNARRTAFTHPKAAAILFSPPSVGLLHASPARVSSNTHRLSRLRGWLLEQMKARSRGGTTVVSCPLWRPRTQDAARRARNAADVASAATAGAAEGRPSRRLPTDASVAAASSASVSAFSVATRRSHARSLRVRQSITPSTTWRIPRRRAM
jgi:hypothetical protein